MPDLSSPSNSISPSSDDWLRSNMRSIKYIRRDVVNPAHSRTKYDIYTEQPKRPITQPETVVQPVVAEVQPQPYIPPQTQEVETSLKVRENFDADSSKVKSLKKINRHAPKLILGMACFLFIIGLYVALTGFKADKASQVQAANLTKAANSSSSSSSSSAISTVKPSAADIANYVVSPNMPRYLIIPKLGVNARIKPLGVTNSDQLEAPTNVYDSGWYNASSLPGQPGAMLIDGHVSSWTTKGVFYGIKQLLPGDQIKVQRGDGQIFVYTVVKSQVFNANQVDMNSAVNPVVAGQPGLNLMTCTGNVIAGTSEFNERIVVYATLQ